MIPSSEHMDRVYPERIAERQEAVRKLLAGKEKVMETDVVWVVYRDGMWWRLFRASQAAHDYADGRPAYTIKKCKIVPVVNDNGDQA